MEEVHKVSFLDKYFSGASINYHHIIALFLPILVDQAFVVCLSMINTAMVSSSGAAAVSAVSMVDYLNLFILNVFIAIATGGTVVIAQYKGSNNEEMVEKSAPQALFIVTVVSFAVSVVLIVCHNLILTGLFGKAEEAVMANARIYFLGSCISYPFYAMLQSVCCSLRGVSETKASLMISLIANSSLVLLNALFIKGFQLGVLGLSVSLIVARVIGSAVGICYLVKFNQTLHFKIRNIFRLDFSLQKRILWIGIPFSMEQMFFHGGKILTQTFVVELGTMPMTVNAIANSLFPILQIPANALSLTIVTVVGQCMGAKNVADSRKFMKSFVGLAAASFVVMPLILVPLLPVILPLFAPPPEIVGDIYGVLWIAALGQPLFWPLSFICPSALRAAGDSKFVSISSLITMWTVRVVLGYVLGITLHFGLNGVWAAMVLEWAVRSTVFTIRFRGTKWCRHRVID